jgi:hypothetical protein
MRKYWYITLLTFISIAAHSQSTCPALLFTYDADGNRTNVTTGTVGCGSDPYQRPVKPKDSASNPSINANVFPNPTNGPVTITITKDSSSSPVSQIYLVDLVGRIVYSTSTTLDYSHLDISSVAEGLYYVKIINGNNKVTYLISKL